MSRSEFPKIEPERCQKSDMSSESKASSYSDQKDTVSMDTEKLVDTNYNNTPEIDAVGKHASKHAMLQKRLT